MSDLVRELRFAGRLLRRTPGFTCVAVLTLGLAIGACTAIYSVVYGVVLRPLPYPRPEQIVHLNQVFPSGGRGSFSDPNFEDLRDQMRSFRGIAEYNTGIASVVTGASAERAGISAVSRDFFDVFATEPSRGRRFAAEELHEGGPRVAIVSDHFWRQHAGVLADLSAARIRVNGEPHTVVGIMPAGFSFPAGTDVWTPREAQSRNPYRTGHNWRAVARLREGVALADTRAAATAVARRLKQQYGEGTLMTDVAVTPLREELAGRVTRVLYVLLASVLLLLLVACANLANVLLARVSTRGRELAVRSALGASSASMTVALMAEPFILAALGGLAGIVLAYAGVRWLATIESAGLPRVEEIRVSWPVLVFAVAVSSTTALALGFVAAWRARRPDIAGRLQNAQRGYTGATSAAFVRGALVVAQLVVSVVLLVGAGLLGRSFAALLNQDPGFRTHGLLTLELASPGPAVRIVRGELEFSDPASLPRQAQLNRRLIDRLRSLPGVVEAGGVSRFPMTGAGSNGTFLIVQGNGPQTLADLAGARNDPGRTGDAEFRVISSGYLRAMGIPLVRGRLFEDHDGSDAPHVALLSESLARARWPNQNPIGIRIQFGGMDGDLRVFTVVGIVGDIREGGLDSPPRPTFYADYRQRPLSTFNFTIVLQTLVDSAGLASDVRRVVREIAPESPPQLRTITEVVGSSVAPRRFTFALTASFAAAAMLVAVLGVYGMLSYLVAQRSREFGVRIALGAQYADVQRLVLKEAARFVIAGLILGLAVALVMSRVLTGMLFAIGPTDPTTYVTVAMALALAAFVACEVPAIRATRVDPVRALRTE